MEIDVFFVKEKILAKQLFFYHIPALYQQANVLTKPLSSARFAFQRQTQYKDFFHQKIFSLSLRGNIRNWLYLICKSCTT